MAYYYHLIEFATVSPEVNEILLKELIRLDYLLREPLREVPKEFETIDREGLREDFNSLLKDDDWVAQYAPNLNHLAPRQRYRLTFLDSYRYPVWLMISNHPKEAYQKLPHKQKVLFDYSTVSPTWSLLMEE